MADQTVPEPAGIPFTREQVEAAVAARGPAVQPLLQMWVLAQYGSAMLQIQVFESQLAGLLLAVNARPRTGNPERQARKSMKRIIHLLEHATAEWMRNELAGKVDVELIEEINYLLPWRNRLAHRYLRQRLYVAQGKELKATPEMVYELFDMSNEFVRVSNLVQAELKRVMGAWPRERGDAPPALVDAITLIMAELLFGKREVFIPRHSSTADTAKQADSQP
jgi:hypothetical protein